MALEHPIPDAVGPGQESVWDYPRPPRLEATDEHVTVSFGGRVVADTRRAFRVLETSHPPTYYVHPDDVDVELLRPVPGSSICEWKGRASYADVVVGAECAERAAWCYRRPSSTFAELDGHYSFYPALVSCRVDGEAVRPQPGGFYGGWITRRVAGPFKGVPGSNWW